MRVRLLRNAALGACALALGAVAPAAALAEDAKPKTLEDYSLVWERNVFSKDRRAWRPTTTRTVRSAPVYTPRNDLVLRGVVEKDGQRIAFIENKRTGGTQRVKRGEEIAGGKLRSIAMGQVEYVVEEQVTVVAIGESLAGAGDSGSATYGAPAAETTQPAGTSTSVTETSTQQAPAGGEDEGLSVLERMRRRREQELK